MKKRKKPIVLGAVFVLLLAFVVAFNFSNFAASEPQDQQPDPKAAAAEKAAKDAEAAKNPILAKEQAEKAKTPAKGVMQKGDDEEVLPIHGKGHDAISASDPKIMAPPVFQPKKIAPKDGSVNSQGQWYSKESGAG